MFLKVDKALSITELSNIGDLGPADYISQSSRAVSRAANTSVADTIILEDLISVSGTSRPYRSRSRSKDMFSNGIQRKNFGSFIEPEDKERYERMKNVTKVIALDEILNHTSPKKVNTKRAYNITTRRKKSNLKKRSRYEYQAYY